MYISPVLLFVSLVYYFGYVNFSFNTDVSGVEQSHFLTTHDPFRPGSVVRSGQEENCESFKCLAEVAGIEHQTEKK